MKSKVEQNTPDSSSGNKIINLVSSYLFFELFRLKKYQQPKFLIPDTILLQKGFIKQWLFNSSKQESRILKKRKQNYCPINLVKSFCFKFGYNFYHLKSILQIKTELNLILKQKGRKQNVISHKKDQDKKIIQIITVDDNIFDMSLSDFVNCFQEDKHNQYMFYERWKIIREKVNNQSKIDQYYQVQNVRKSDLIQNRCHKIITLQAGQLTQMSTTDLQSDRFRDLNPSKQLSDNETKNIQGYKFFDTFLNKKFFKISQQLIQFIEKNYKCIVQEVKTHFVINKIRQPYLVGVYKLKIKPAKKLSNVQGYQSFIEKGFIRTQEYIKCLNIYLAEYSKSLQTSLTTPVNFVRKTKCLGDFCKVKVKKLPHLTDPISNASKKSKVQIFHSNLQPQLKRTVYNDIILSVRKRIPKVLQKLRAQDIIDSCQIKDGNDSSYYQESDEQTGRDAKVCQNCYQIYLDIQRLYQIEFRSGNLVQKKQSILNNQALRFRAHSQRKPRLVSKKMQFQSTRKQETFNKNQTNRNYRQNLKQSQKKPKLISLRSRSQSGLRKQDSMNSIPNKNKQIQGIDKLKLDQIQNKAVKIVSTKGSRLMALTKSPQGMSFNLTNKLQKPYNKFLRIPSPRNYQQAQNILVKKLSVLPASSKQQFMSFAKKYWEDYLPQEIERKCHSSEYVTNLYEFMNNSELNVHPRNKIRKRPQISGKRLSQLTDYPQIVSKSAFHFDTVITDEKTTIPFCLITAKMINGSNVSNMSYQNIIIVNDIFDCFIEYIPLVRDVLQSSENKRIILFNYPGQSHTIYNSQVPMNFPQFSFIVDKLLYRLSTQKEQLGFIDLRKDNFKFVGFGYGGYMLTSYLAGNYLQTFGANLSGVLLVNTYKNITQTWKHKIQALNLLYQSNDQVAISQAFLFYNKAIQSSQTDMEDLQHKSGLNSIRMHGRVFLLKSILQMAQFEVNSHNFLVQNFQNINSCPVHIIYGRHNVLFTKSDAQRLLIYEDTKMKKQQIPQRKFIQIQSGHDIMAEDYDSLQKYVEAFVNL